MKTNNPLLKVFDTPYNTTPFTEIKPEHFKPAITQLIEKTRKEIEAITEQKATPSFKNTIEPFAFAGLDLENTSLILSNLNTAETNKTLQDVADEVMPMLTAFHNEIMLNKALYERVKYVFDHQSDEELNDEQKMLLTKNYKSFVRNGANLSPEKQEQLKNIDQELTKLKLNFSKNVLAETNDYSLHITDKKILEGIPQDALQRAAQLAEEKEKDGWIFTLHYPSFSPVLKYAKNREIRREIAIAAGSRAFKNNTYDNQENVLSIVRLRKQRAELLGYNTYADFVLEERMAKKPENVLKFLNEIYEPAFPAAQKEIKKINEIAQKDGISQIEKWDIAYYSEKLKKQELDLDEEALKPYFQLDKVVSGVFGIAQKLYGLQFKKIDNIQKYHPDVDTYKVTDDQGELVAIFYADFFPRSGKKQGAWMTSFKPQYKKDGENHRPHISIVTNFTPAGKEKPSLLNFNEVTTLFHEFGHALHGMLANTTYPSLSGTNVYWDFVELPSQIMENWAYEKEALKTFAKHYQTGEIIPIDFIEKIKKSKQFMEGYATSRQLSFGFLDMAWHHNPEPEKITNVGEFEKKSLQKTRLLPYHKENNASVAFSHIFPGGYAAGYYSYKWAEVLDADAFAYFQEKGIFNPEVAKKFKKLLSQGGTKHPMTLYKEFRGHEPQVSALLKRAGLKR